MAMFWNAWESKAETASHQDGNGWRSRVKRRIQGTSLLPGRVSAFQVLAGVGCSSVGEVQTRLRGGRAGGQAGR
jgi:hypothetical protein